MAIWRVRSLYQHQTSITDKILGKKNVTKKLKKYQEKGGGEKRKMRALFQFLTPQLISRESKKHPNISEGHTQKSASNQGQT